MKRFLIIDGSALLSTSYYGNLPPSIKYAKTEEEKEKHYDELLQTSNGVYTNGIYGVAQTVLKILREQKPEYMAFVFDKTRNTFRKRLYPDYKGTRKEKPVPLKAQFINAEKMLANMGFKVFVSDEYEADDLAGSLAERFKGLPDLMVTVMTKDFDYVQLLDQKTNVTAWMMRSGTSNTFSSQLTGTNAPEGVDDLDEAAACERYQLPNAKAVIEYKALAGDSSDNIPGVKGVGEKSAQKLIMKYHTIGHLYAEMDEKGSSIEDEWKEELGLRKGNYKKLAAGREMAELSHTLATIKTDISFGYQLSDFCTPWDREKFDRELEKYEMESLRADLLRESA